MGADFVTRSTSMICICTDSNSQLTNELARRFGITVVALPMSVDGRDHYEGVDLDVDDFYSAWDDGHTPRISTSQPLRCWRTLMTDQDPTACGEAA